MLAIPTGEVGTSHGGTSLADIRHTVPPGVLVGGDPAQTVDETSATYGAFPLMFGLVALVTFLLLARGLRSILLPAKAVLLNALSVANAGEYAVRHNPPPFYTSLAGCSTFDVPYTQLAGDLAANTLPAFS